MKAKTKNKLITWISTVLIAGCIGLFAYQTNNYKKVNAEEYIEITQPKNAIFNDEGLTIQLTPNELNNYSWDNFYTATNMSLHANITYNGQTYEQGGPYEFSYESTSIEFFTTGNKITKYEAGVPEDFSFNLVLQLTDTYYSDYKTAIELDIEENQPTPQPSATMGESIIETITSGLGLIGDLASEFLVGFTTLFYANGSLTTFGIWSLVFLGVAISFAVIGLVLRLIRSNTGV